MILSGSGRPASAFVRGRRRVRLYCSAMASFAKSAKVSASPTWVRITRSWYVGSAMVVRMPRMAMTIISSMSVKPRFVFMSFTSDDGTELEDRHVEPDHEKTDEDRGREMRREEHSVERRRF